jgi:hypothetical protein
MASLHNDNRYLEVQPGRGAQPQVSGSGARLKKLYMKLATPNSPSTVYFYHNMYEKKTMAKLMDLYYC